MARRSPKSVSALKTTRKPSARGVGGRRREDAEATRGSEEASDQTAGRVELICGEAEETSAGARREEGGEAEEDAADAHGEDDA